MKKLVQLGELAEINPPLTMGRTLKPDDTISFVPMASVSVDGILEKELDRPYSEVAKGFTPFERGDVLVAKITPCFENMKSALVNDLKNKVGFGSTEFHVLRARAGTDLNYLFRLVRSDKFVRAGTIMMRGAAGQKRVPQSFLESFKVEKIDLKEQRRIADLLDKVAALRRKNAEAQRLAADLVPAVFYEMFGNAFENEKKWPKEPLELAVQISGGGTPSKSNPEFWEGAIPWVSPKDMKMELITDAEDHITEEAIANSATHLIPRDAVLIVFRSGILQHTLPVALTGREVAINQDIKALIPDRKKILPVFLWAWLKTGEQKFLTLVKDGPTVQSFDGDKFYRLPLVIPPMALQEKFAERVTKIQCVKKNMASRRVGFEQLFGSMQARAF